MTAVRENGSTSGAGVLATYGYDDLGRRVSLTRGNGASTSYAYDSASRLASLGHDLGGTGADVTFSFGFNPASQISSNTRSNDAYAWAGHGSGTSSSNVNGLNQLTASGSGSRSHDSKGNTVFDGATHFAYSSENLLTSQTVTSASPSWLRNATFGYDPAMRLYESSSGTSSSRWLYDGWDLAAEYNGSGALLRRYVRGPGGEHLVTLVPASGGTARYWSHSDERGSYIRGSKGDGTADTAQATTYDEYGRQGGAWSNMGIGGERYMLYTDLIYLRHRAYNPADGRFMQPDPIGYDDGMNMYAYVGGDPVNFGDPSGLCKDGAGKNVGAPTGSRICGGHGRAGVYGGIAGHLSGSTTAGPGGAGGPTFGEAYQAAKDLMGGYGSRAVNATADYFMGSGSFSQVRTAVNAGRVESFGYGGSSSFLLLAGNYNGHRTFGDNPSFSNRPNRHFPGGRITSGGQGGYAGALGDLDRLAKLNNLTSPSGVNIFRLPPQGWVPSFNPVSGYQILTHLGTGLTFRAHGARNVVVIDIPPGLVIGNGAFDVGAFWESVHYR